MLLRILPRAAALLMLCVQHLHASVLPTVSSYEFTAYRMQQYAIQQEKHGRVTWPDILKYLHQRKVYPCYFIISKYIVQLCGAAFFLCAVLLKKIFVHCFHYFVFLFSVIETGKTK